MSKLIQQCIPTAFSMSVVLMSSPAAAQTASAFSVGLSLRTGGSTRLSGAPDDQGPAVHSGVDLLAHWRFISFGVSGDYTRGTTFLSAQRPGYSELHGAFLSGFNLSLSRSVRIEVLGEVGAHGFPQVLSSEDIDAHVDVIPYLGARLGGTWRTQGAVRFVVGLWMGVRQDQAQQNLETVGMHTESHLHPNRIIGDFGVHYEEKTVYDIGSRSFGGSSAWAALSLGVEL